MKRVLVAGGTGIIGSYLKQVFSTENFTYLGSQDCDLSSESAINKYFTNTKKYDILIFLVGLAHGKGSKNNSDDFTKTNYETLVNLISYFKTHRKLPDKIIFASTISVYGEQKNIYQYDESSYSDPFSPYAVTKLMAEKFLLDKLRHLIKHRRRASFYTGCYFRL